MKFQMMKLILLILILYLAGCSNSDKKENSEGAINHQVVKSLPQRGALNEIDTSVKRAEKKEVTITVSYAHIACGCAQWFETKYGKAEYLEGVERFYIEPIDTSIENAIDLWNGEGLPPTLKLTGRFSIVKGLPPTIGEKDETEKARIFWYNKMVVVSSASKKSIGK